MTNQDIAARLRAHARELSRAGSNLYRVRAYRQAAIAVLALPDPVADLVTAGGPEALERLPGVGRSLAGTIAGYAAAGDEAPRTAA